MGTGLWQLPSFRVGALRVWRRNLLVWRKLIGPAVVMNFGEPILYLLGFGYGLGFFIREIETMPYLTFLASGIIASSAMTTSSFEGMYSVFTRMSVQRTYEALLATPLEVDEIVSGEMLWCATKSLFSGIAILSVATALGVVQGVQALWVLPVVFLTGLCFAGPAIVMSALSPSYDFFNYYFVLAITPMMLLSGVFYPVSSLPVVLQDLVQVLPLAHSVSLTRPMVAGLPLEGVSVHLAVLGAYAVVSFYLAVVLVRRRLLR